MHRLIAFLVCGWLLAEVALAQSVFRWTDEDGHVHYGHAVPAEHRHRGYERLAPDGRVLERVSRAMTDEERAAENERQAELAELEALRASQALIDRRLLASYRSISDIEATRQSRIESLQAQRDALQRSLELSSARFEDMVARASQRNRADEPLSPALEDAISDAQDEIRRLRTAIDEIDRRQLAVEAGFDAEIERFRELTETQD
ncbi:MAG: DUF4124 domain-containing protein [Wenzhouxiangella sp.]|jgi:hypothetical protein|nr:DUF4124 domain-containing protein [Wenzhouxiangella sp.]